MSYLEIFLAVTFCSLLVFILAPKNSLVLLPWNWPLMKLMPTMYLKSHHLYDKITHILVENKGTILFKTSWFTNLDILVTSDPANVQHVLNSNYSIYQRGSEFRKAFDFLGPAAFTKDLHEWREDKKFTHAFYKDNKFHKSTPKIIHHTLEKGLIPVLDHVSQQNQVLDLQNLFNRYMLDATCLLATGFDLGSLRVDFPKAPLLDAMDDIVEAVFFRHIMPERVWRMQKWLRIGKEKKLAEAYIVVDQIIGDYVSRKRVAAKNQETGDDFDVLKFYLGEAGGGSKGSKKYAEKDFLVANIATLLFAGRDTSAGLLAWFFYLISKNPLVENKILEEIRQFSPPQKYLFSKVEELSKLVYLHSALIESLRLYPTVPFIIRDPTKEDVLPSGHKVDQTTKVFVCTYAMGRMSEIWGKDCNEFKPERWISEKEAVKHVASHIFIAFGSGPWACPGREVAFTRMKAVVATILHNFHVRVLDGQSISPSVSATLYIKHGLKATLSNRWV